jgi:hypothetical protein
VPLERGAVGENEKGVAHCIVHRCSSPSMTTGSPHRIV